LKRVVVVAFFIAVALASIGPIRNYDLFWHLATGRWIAEHGALPRSDPFALASDRGPWVNGEWLFEVVLHGFERIGGIAGLTWLRALMIAALFALVFLFTSRDTDPPAALLLTALAFAGAIATVDLRPATVAAIFVAILIGITRADNALLYMFLIVLWINVHPSAILAPVIVLLLTRKWTITLVSAAALLVNPYGIYGVLAPLKLTLFASSGAFVNAEWLPSSPLVFPLLYVTIAIWGAAALAAGLTRKSVSVPAALQLLVAVLLAFLAIRHVRNQPLWFAAFPLLTAQCCAHLSRLSEARWKRAPLVAYTVSALAVLFVALRADHRVGVSPSRFPIEAVARLRSTRLRGNIYNPDQFGGFLIWSLYPERRTLTDGRNELYRAFIPEYDVARRDQRAWRALLRKYRIDLAVDEYRPPLDVINGVTREQVKLPASLAYWPRNQWALIGFDRAAMVFARRAAFPRGEIEKWEIHRVVPDAAR
jgi:hypothetical protein